MKILLLFISILLLMSGCEADIEATDNRTGDKSEVNITVEPKQKEDIKEDDHSMTKMTDEDIEDLKNYKW